MCRPEDYEHLGSGVDWDHWWGQGIERKEEQGRKAYLEVAKNGLASVGPEQYGWATDYVMRTGLAWPPPPYEVALANVRALEKAKGEG